MKPTIIIKGKYSHTNNKGYNTNVIVTRYNDKSVWATWENGNYEHRISIKRFLNLYKKE